MGILAFKRAHEEIGLGTGRVPWLNVSDKCSDDKGDLVVFAPAWGSMPLASRAGRSKSPGTGDACLRGTAFGYEPCGAELLLAESCAP